MAHSGEKHSRLLYSKVALVAALGALWALGCGDIKVAPGDVCETDTDCAPGQMCVDNRCGTVCATDEQCTLAGLGSYCDDGRCVSEPPGKAISLRVRVGDELFENPESPLAIEVEEDAGRLTLDAGESEHRDGHPLSFEWEITDDGGLEDLNDALQDASQAKASFDVPRVYHDTTIRIELRVILDSQNSSLALSITILNTINEPPVLTVTTDNAQVLSGDTVRMEVEAHDPNDDELALPFEWVQRSGPPVTLVDAGDDDSFAVASFTAPEVEEASDLEFEVSVADLHATPETGSAQITVKVMPFKCASDNDCDESEICDNHGRCVPCAPDCTGIECGPDPICHKSCGECEEGEWCVFGSCTDTPCEPSCDGYECGLDPVCGVEVCGRCDDDERCVSGLCAPAPPATACNNEDDLGKLNEADSFAIAEYCVLDAACGLDEECLATCIVEQTGLSGECAACWGAFAACGTASCLVDCNVEDPTETSCIDCLETNCTPALESCAGITWDLCLPDCDVIECGPDPLCDWDCGACPEGEWCDRGTCRPTGGVGACNTRHDLEALGAYDHFAELLSCMFSESESCDWNPACIGNECVGEPVGISADCADCWGEFATCGHKNNCPSGDSHCDQECTACMMENCQDAFETCSGMDWRWCVPECRGVECGPDPNCGVSCGRCPRGFVCQYGECRKICFNDRDCFVAGEICIDGVCQPGNCNNENDRRILLDYDPPGTLFMAVLEACYGECAKRPPLAPACFASCAAERLGFTGGCAMCVGETTVCTHEKCSDQCSGDLSKRIGDSCNDCIGKICGDDFLSCSGLGESPAIPLN